ncbi:hypothetical protein [Clostridium manihotivorum]|uniref:ABC-2 type transport system permease protein n=1 Tax=Clostridium manihotivorum TaxID=2320868 RepID=A0A3R5QZF2_9CLOT|nr:hypothetical protein [Clostridium manihotivorum]QAA33146.1 hypothetical protein C1I91_16720 [Clostridium manihotivorum]
MLKTFINSFNVSFAQNANSFIFFLKRLPLVGKKIPDRLYKETGIKTFFGVLNTILKFIGGFFKAALYIGIMIVLPAYLITKDKGDFYGVFLNIYFFLSFIIGPVIKSSIFDITNKEAYDMINLMRCDAKEYLLSHMIYEKTVSIINMTIPLFIFGLIFKIAFLNSLILLIEILFVRYTGEFLQLIFYNKTKKVLAQTKIISTLVILISLFLAYGLPLLNISISFQHILFRPFLVCLIFILAFLSVVYVFKYRNYKLIAKKVFVKENIFNPETAKVKMQFSNVELNEKRVGKELLDSSRFDKKQGYDYLNSIFFYRHRKIMIYPIKIRVYLILAILVFFVGYLVIFPGEKSGVLKYIDRSQPVMVFILYIMSTGERVCKAMFHNCDVSLLRYGFYRESKTILSNFNYRVKKIILLNLIPAVVLMISIMVVILVCGASGRLFSMIPYFVSILCLACFFSIHHLFMYYVVQPYTAELTVKSPFYKISNAIIYFISYFCLNFKTSSFYFTIGVLVVTILYTIIAILLTYKLAPKTFKLKE